MDLDESLDWIELRKRIKAMKSLLNGETINQ